MLSVEFWPSVVASKGSGSRRAGARAASPASDANLEQHGKHEHPGVAVAPATTGA
jgi:hypothetical protein